MTHVHDIESIVREGSRAETFDHDTTTILETCDFIMETDLGGITIPK